MLPFLSVSISFLRVPFLNVSISFLRVRVSTESFHVFSISFPRVCEGFHFLSESLHFLFWFPFRPFVRVSIVFKCFFDFLSESLWGFPFPFWKFSLCFSISFLKVCEGFLFLSESFPFLFSISCVGFSSFCLRVEGFLFFSDCLWGCPFPFMSPWRFPFPRCCFRVFPWGEFPRPFLVSFLKSPFLFLFTL